MTLDDLEAAADRCLSELNESGGYPDGLSEEDVRALAGFVRGVGPLLRALLVSCDAVDNSKDPSVLILTEVGVTRHAALRSLVAFLRSNPGADTTGERKP